MATATETQVLEFSLGSEQYCVDIHQVAEIVDMGELTAVPNSPEHVEGVMDLRGRTTSIVDPKVVLDVERGGARERIVVFDPEAMDLEEPIGWIVDDVAEVFDLDPATVDDTDVADDPAIRGIVKRENSFVIWLDPVRVARGET